MDQEPLSADGWTALLGRLPAGLDLEASARERGAWRRPRGVRSAADLLRLALAYANTPLSLRGTAAWAAASGVADLSDVALLYRLRNAGGWLEEVLAALLAVRGAAPAGLRRPVEIVDATNLAPTGARHATTWRVHARFDPAMGRFAEFRLTEGAAPESLARFSPPAGAVCVADRIYAKARGLFAAKGRGADVVVRYGMTGCALLDEGGARLGLKDVLARGDLPDLADVPVRVPRPDAPDDPPLDARLILWRRPADVAAAARERARREARRKGYEAGAKQLGGAGWLVLLTTLDDAVPAADVLALYRLRWQVELAFKRLKSQLRLDDLQAKDRRLARSCVLAKLILAALTDQCLGEALALSPSAPGPHAVALAPRPAGARRPARRGARRTPTRRLDGAHEPPPSAARRATATPRRQARRHVAAVILAPMG